MITIHHGESKTLWYVVNAAAADDEQPAVIETCHSLAEAEDRDREIFALPGQGPCDRCGACDCPPCLYSGTGTYFPDHAADYHAGADTPHNTCYHDAGPCPGLTVAYGWRGKRLCRECIAKSVS